MCCKAFFRIFPKRYFLAILSFIVVLLQISMRTVFSMTIIHLNSTAPRSNCTGGNSTDDLSEKYNQDNSDCKCIVLTDDERIHWSTIIYSQIVASYFYGYVITQIPGGLMSQRFAAYKVFGYSCFLSFLLFLIIPFVMQRSWEAVIIIRLLQGLVEGVSLPAMNGVLTHWARSAEKTRLVTIMASGAYLSAAVGLGITGTMLCSLGWQSPFYLFSGVGMFFSIFWLLVIRETPMVDKMIGTVERDAFLFSRTGRSTGASSEQAQTVPWKAIFTSLPVSAIFIASFCRCWVFFLLLTEQPQYFRDVFAYDIEQIGALSTLPHICMTIVVLFGGVIADKLMSSGTLSRTAVRKLFNCGGFGVEAAAMLGLSFLPSTAPILAIALLTFGVGFSGFAISGYQVNPHDLAPDRASILSGVSKLGSVAGIIMPYMVSYITANKTATEWDWVFRISAIIHFAGVIYYAIFASGQIQPWSARYQKPVANVPEPPPASYGTINEAEVGPDAVGPILESEVTGLIGVRARLMRESIMYETPHWYRSTDLGQ